MTADGVFRGLLREAALGSGLVLSYTEEVAVVQGYEGGTRRVHGVVVWAVNVFGEKEAVYSGSRGEAAAFLRGVAAVFRVVGGFRIREEAERVRAGDV